MKVRMEKIKMIAWFDSDGIITPVRFQLKVNDESITIKIDNIVFRDKEKLAGNKMFIYRCQSEINGALKTFELKYEIGSCLWYLYKI